MGAKRRAYSTGLNRSQNIQGWPISDTLQPSFPRGISPKQQYAHSRAMHNSTILLAAVCTSAPSR